MKLILCFLFFLFTFCVAEIPSQKSIGLVQEWNNWKKQYEKRYSSLDEELYKFQIWSRNYEIIKNHNSNKFEAAGFTLMMNQFGDLDHTTNHHYFHVPHFKYPIKSKLNRVPSYVPDFWDWRDSGAVTPVVNQGTSGEAVAISITGCIESYHKINVGQLYELSFTQLQDCCSNDTISGCTRNMLVDAWNCIIKMNGLCGRDDYKRKPDCSCNKNSCKPLSTIKGYKNVSAENETALKMAVFQNPVSVLVDASHISFQFYKAGVYYEPHCNSNLLDHSLLVIGYGTMNGKNYWLCRNSWGSAWGMEGYIMMARDRNNNCGIATAASFPV